MGLHEKIAALELKMQVQEQYWQKKFEALETFVNATASKCGCGKWHYHTS